MSGRIGTATRISTVLPGAIRVSRSINISKGARIRLKWIEHYKTKGQNARATCRHFGISPSLFYKWYKRYHQMGLLGLEEKTRRPHHFRKSSIPLEHVDLLRTIRKKYPYFSKYKLNVILKRDYGIELSPSTIGRIITKYSLFFATKVKCKKERYRTVRKRLPKGFKAAFPGDLVQGDTKHVSFFGPKRYFYAITDCVTKFTAIRVSSSPSSKQAAIAFSEAREKFPYPIKNTNNDNGSENLKNLTQYLNENYINQYFSRPRTPKDNPYVERMIGTIEREFIQQGKLAFDLAEQQQLIDEWLVEYHTFRPHQALNYLTPYENYERIKV